MHWHLAKVRQDIVQLRGCRAADRFGARFLQAKCTGAPVCCCIAGDMFKLRRTGNEDDLRGDHPYVRKENACNLGTELHADLATRPIRSC